MLNKRHSPFLSGELIRLPEGASLPMTLKVLEYEIFHFCPLNVSPLTGVYLFSSSYLNNSENELFKHTTTQEIATNISFAPIGLLDMFNSGGAVEQVEVHMASEKPELFDGEIPSELSTSLSENRSPTATIALTVRGCGRFGAYSSQRPLKCLVDHAEVEFSYDPDNGLLTFTIPIPEQEMYRWSVTIQV